MVEAMRPWDADFVKDNLPNRWEGVRGDCERTARVHLDSKGACSTNELHLCIRLAIHHTH